VQGLARDLAKVSKFQCGDRGLIVWRTVTGKYEARGNSRSDISQVPSYMSSFRSPEELHHAMTYETAFTRLFFIGPGAVGAETVWYTVRHGGVVPLTASFHEQPDLLLSDWRHRRRRHSGPQERCPHVLDHHDSNYLDKIGNLPKEGVECLSRVVQSQSRQGS